MWVRIGAFAVKAGQSQALCIAYNQRAAPKVRACTGNLGCFLLEPAVEGDPFVVLTMWQDQAASEDYEASGKAAEIVAMVREYFQGPPTLRSYVSSTEAAFGLRP
jgi:heme-degrading monooxygenase HmoA